MLADEVAKTGKKILPLNIGDPLKFDFATPPHMIDAVAKAMRDGKNGYAASSGLAKLSLQFTVRPSARASRTCRTCSSPAALANAWTSASLPC